MSDFSLDINDIDGEEDEDKESFQPFTLEVPDPDETKKQVKKVTSPTDKRLAQIDAYSTQQGKAIMDASIDTAEGRLTIKNAVDSIGRDAVRRSTSKTTMMSKQMKDIGSTGTASAEVANGLEELSIQMRDLDPSGIDFMKKGPMSRLFNPVRKYFERYRTADAEIADIVKSLQKGRRVLSDDNITLQQEEEEMRDLTRKLNDNIQMSIDLNAYLKEQVEQREAAFGEGDERVKFVKEEVIFPLEQRIVDLQTQLAVNQQGIVAMDVLRRNNEELIRSVDRAQTTTIAALRVAVTIASALYDQQVVMKKVDMLNDTTNQMIANTSRMLKDQGAQIQAQASKSSVSPEVMKQAFRDTFDALDQISDYKQRAIPMLQEQIDTFQELATEGEKRLKQIDDTGVFDH